MHACEAELAGSEDYIVVVSVAVHLMQSLVNRGTRISGELLVYMRRCLRNARDRAGGRTKRTTKLCKPKDVDLDAAQRRKYSPI
ncbi:hypothetical protein AHF37_10082 [Paragonimus kellicotti]|nr:hypothetical protein AHF37_10082 [Paragonimus kellicotti]